MVVLLVHNINTHCNSELKPADNKKNTFSMFKLMGKNLIHLLLLNDVVFFSSDSP